MRVLVTGGSASGKSAFAEQVALALPGPHVYIATMRPWGRDGSERVERHRKARAGRGFVTVECYEDYASLDLDRACAASLAGHVVPGDASSLEGALPLGTVLLECMGNVVANMQFDEGAAEPPIPPDDPEALARAAERAVHALARQCGNLVIVTNEVGADGVEYPFETQTYVRALGAASCALARWADEAYEVCAGVPRPLGRVSHALELL